MENWDFGENLSSKTTIEICFRMFDQFLIFLPRGWGVKANHYLFWSDKPNLPGSEYIGEALDSIWYVNVIL